jgi:hypothetical protein
MNALSPRTMRTPVDFSSRTNLAPLSDGSSDFGYDSLAPAHSTPTQVLPKSLTQATSGWLGNNGCLDLTGSATEVKSDMANGGAGSIGALGCTGDATEVKSDMAYGGEGSIGALGCTGGATEVKSDMAYGGEGSIGALGCTGGATEVKAGYLLSHF